MSKLTVSWKLLSHVDGIQVDKADILVSIGKGNRRR